MHHIPHPFFFVAVSPSDSRTLLPYLLPSLLPSLHPHAHVPPYIHGYPYHHIPIPHPKSGYRRPLPSHISSTITVESSRARRLWKLMHAWWTRSKVCMWVLFGSIFHVLQLLPIWFTPQNSCCIIANPWWNVCKNVDWKIKPPLYQIAC